LNPSTLLSSELASAESVVTKRKAKEYTYEEIEHKTSYIEDMDPPSSFCRPIKMLKIQNKEPFICNDRPYNPRTPITLYHKTFAVFQENCTKIAITKKDCASVIELIEIMTKVYEKEKERQKEFNSWLSDYFNLPVDKLPLPSDHQEADIGSVINIGNISFMILVGEIKNEIGEGGGCAYVQACASYAKRIGLNQSNVVRQGLNPAFLLYLAGPYLGIAGAVLGKEFTMEPLTPMLPLLFVEHDLNLMESLARTLLALKIGLRELKNYYITCYEKVQYIENNTLLRSDSFPYICQFMIGETKFSFSYVRQLYNDKLLFLVEGLSGDFLNKLILVKFVKRYGVDIHIYCAEKEIAPKLYAINTIPGWSIVFMEYLLKYVNIYTAIHDLKLDRRTLLEKVENTTKILHDGGFAHGDLRASNIMVSTDMKQMKIVDFDWGGPDGKVFYPYFISNTVPWHHDVECGKPILIEHDKYLLKKLLNDNPL